MSTLRRTVTRMLGARVCSSLGGARHGRPAPRGGRARHRAPPSAAFATKSGGDVYTHGHHSSVVSQHAARTAEDSAAFLLDRLQPGQKILDAGCGPGSISVGLAKAVGPKGELVAIDVDEGIVARAAATLATSGAANASCAVASLYDLSSFADDSFDVAYANQVLQHLSDPVAALAELRRVVRPGGLVAVRDADYSSMTGWPNEMAEWRRIYRQTCRKNNAEPDAGRYLVQWARAAGFASDAIEFSASLKVYSRAEDEQARRRWGEDWAERTLRSSFGKQALQYGVASADEMQAVAEAWQDWAETPESFFHYVNGEVIATV